MVLAGVLALAACGGSEQGSPNEVSVTGTAEAQLPPPTVEADIPLVEYQSPDKGYTLGYPSGWEVEAGPDLFADIFARKSESGRSLAQLNVSCNKDALTTEKLAGIDAAVASRYGAVDPSGVTPVEIAGTTGGQLRYRIGVAGTAIEQVAVYAPGDECGWRLALAAYGDGTLASYLPLFERIVASFRPG